MALPRCPDDRGPCSRKTRPCAGTQGLSAVAGDGVKRVAHPVARAEENQRPVADPSQRRRRPLAVKYTGANLLVVGGQEPAGPLVQGNQTGRRRAGVRLVVDAVCRAHEQDVAEDEHGTCGGVMGKDRQAGHVEPPNDVGILGPRFDGRMPGRNLVMPFVEERPVISVGHAVDVQAEDFVAIGHDVNAIAVDGRRRADSQPHGVEVGCFSCPWSGAAPPAARGAGRLPRPGRGARRRRSARSADR